MSFSEFTEKDYEVIAQAYEQLRLSAEKRCANAAEMEVVRRAFDFANDAHRNVRRRSGEPYMLHPIAVAQIVVEVVDEQGNVVPLADNNISCFVRGNARLLGMENGNIRDTNVSPNANNCRVHNGRLIAYIQKQHLSHRNPSTPNINIRFTSPLLKPAFLLDY